MDNEIFDAEMQAKYNQKIDALEKELEEAKEEIKLMKNALNRRADQASRQLRETFKKIYSIAGNDAYNPLSDDQELICALFSIMVKKTPAETMWDNRNNKSVTCAYTDWEQHLW